ncbi:MAG TPA: hypothetical protein PLA50_02885 [Bacteroidia bacterium]|nr:hypothetical protein [Bacteroidia bacterium]
MKPFAILCSWVLLCSVARAEPGPELPSITVRCGQTGLLLRKASQWTPGRIDFRDRAMTTEHSAYGTVFSFPGVGFIGTGHLENEPEPLVSLAFFLDGKEAEPAAEMSGETFRFVRESTVRDFRLRCEVELRGDRLFETTTVRTGKEVPLTLVYHFMHAWNPTVSAFLAGSDAAPNEVEGGAFLDTEEATRKFHIQRRVDWIAVYDPTIGQFAVSRLLAAPEAAGNVSTIWNVPGTYRKYYLKCFEKRPVPTGFEETWRMVTGFGEADADSWEGKARELAAALVGAE